MPDQMVDRRIYFFRAVFQNPDPVLNQLVSIPDESVGFRHVNGLAFVQGAPNSRYLKNRDGDDFVLFVDHLGPDRIEGRMAVSRRSNFPSLEIQGAVSRLPVPAGAGLVETSHFILFRDRRILAMEYNFYGPRANTLSYYMDEKGKDVCRRTAFEPFVLHDVHSQVARIGEVKWATIAVHRDKRGLLHELDGHLGVGLDHLAEVGDAEQLVVSLGTAKRKTGINLRFGLRRLADLLSRQENRESFETFEIKATDVESGKTATFDLLKDKLVAVKKVLRADEESRSIESISMFTAIREAYIEVGPHLV